MNLRHFLVQDIGRFLSDKTWICIKYFQWFRKFPDLKQPKTFNEKLQWLKLNNRQSEYTIMVDKYAAKKHVADRIGAQYVIPLEGGPWKTFEDIDFEMLPQRFVLKTTHDCGGVLICKDKSRVDKEAAKAFFEKHLKTNYYLTTREWPYKNIVPRIFAEQYMEDKGNEILPVYKIMCFSGIPRLIQTIQNDKQPNESIDYFDIEWNRLDLRQNYPNSAVPLSKPQKLGEMLEIAKVLSNGHPFLRVDLYLINENIYFSEYTFFSDAGLAKFDPPEWDEKLGDLIILPERK